MSQYLKSFKKKAKELLPGWQTDMIHRTARAQAGGFGKAKKAKKKLPKILKEDDSIMPDVSPADISNMLCDEGNGTVGGTIRDGSDSEKFSLGSLSFDINKARKISDGKANGEVQVSPEWSQRINIDGDAAMQSKSQNPVFIAQIPTKYGLKKLLIDGHHRMHKAVAESKSTWPAYIFSPEETLSILETHPDLKEALQNNMQKVAKDMPGSSDVHVPSAGEELPKKKLNKDASGDLERAKAADLVTFPEDISGAVCENCLWVDGNRCTQPDVAQELKDGPDKMCCSYWDAPGVEREWESVEKEVIAPEIDNTGPKVLEKIQAAASQKADKSKPVHNNGDEPSSDVHQDSDASHLSDMQQLVSGIDWEMDNGTNDYDGAKQQALENLSNDQDHYKKKRLNEEWSSDPFTKGQETDRNGLYIDLGSGPQRQAGHIGFDTYPYDYGTVVHDLSMGIPLPSESVAKVNMTNALHLMDSEDQKALLSEIQRVLMPNGQFVYEGPNEIYNYPDWLVQTWYDDAPVAKIEGRSSVRQHFTRVAIPDAATANDAEPRVGIAQFDMLPADALLAMDAVGYYYSDASSSGRGNRLHGYPSQGALVDKGGPGSGPSGGASRDRAAEKDKAKNEEKYQHIMRIAERNRQASTRMAKGMIKKAFEAVFNTGAKKTIENATCVPIFKADLKKQIVYGVVLAPNEIDAQDDWMTPEDIENTAHSYLAKSRVIGSGHARPIDAHPVESYIAPQDFVSETPYGKQEVKKGSWILGVKIKDPKEWQKVLDGDYESFSVGGLGLRK